MARKKHAPAALKGPELLLKDLQEAGDLSSSLDLPVRGSERGSERGPVLRPVRGSERSLLQEIQSIRSLILDLRTDLAQLKGGTKTKTE